MKIITSKDITQGYWKIDYDHTHNKPPYTIAVGNCNTGFNWEEIASVYNLKDAEAIANLPNLLKENESLRAINDELLEALKGLYDNPQPNPTIYHGADYFDRQSNNINAKINALEVITKATK